MASILCCKDFESPDLLLLNGNQLYKAALGAEGVGKDINMIVGNGYTRATLRSPYRCFASVNL